MKPTATKTVTCPTCQQPAAWSPENRWRPFCSERCKLIDRGQWATETYRVPVADADPEEAPPVD
jgi:endogenous inhibitor of DNA gyrase (YacG/DUF329 family)